MEAERRYKGAQDALQPEIVELDDKTRYNWAMQYRVARSEARLDMFDKTFKELIAEIHSLRWWVLGVVIGGVLTTVGVMVCLAQLQSSWFQNNINAYKESVQKQIEEADKRWQAINAEQQKRFEIMMDRLEKRTDRLERKQN